MSWRNRFCSGARLCRCQCHCCISLRSLQMWPQLHCKTASAVLCWQSHTDVTSVLMLSVVLGPSLLVAC